jgi:hypothetical protein
MNYRMAMISCVAVLAAGVGGFLSGVKVEQAKHHEMSLVSAVESGGSSDVTIWWTTFKDVSAIDQPCTRLFVQSSGGENWSEIFIPERISNQLGQIEAALPQSRHKDEQTK